MFHNCIHLSPPYLRLLSDLNKILFSEFDSRLSIGTIESNMIQLRGDTSRQYISYPEGSSSPVVKFVGEKAELKLKNFYQAFGMQLRNDFLKNAMFPESVVFAYTSTDEGNRVPKCDVTKILFLENCNFGLKF